MSTSTSIDADKMVLKGVLNRAKSITEAAKMAGMARNTFKSRAKKYGLIQELKELQVAGKLASQVAASTKTIVKPLKRIPLPALAPANILTKAPKPITRVMCKDNAEEHLALNGEMREAQKEQEIVHENRSTHQRDDFFAELEKRLGNRPVESLGEKSSSRKKMLAHALLTLVPILVAEYHSES